MIVITFLLVKSIMVSSALATNISISNVTLLWSSEPIAQDYGLNWTIAAKVGTNFTYIFTVNKVGNLTPIVYKSSCTSIQSMHVENGNISSSHLMVQDTLNVIKLYKLNSSNIFDLTYTSTISAKLSVMGVSGCLIFIDQNNSIIHKVDTSSYSISKNYSFASENIVITHMIGESGKIVVYAYNKSNNGSGYLMIFDEELVKVGTVNCKYVFESQPKKSASFVNIAYEPNKNIVMRVTTFYAQVWDASTNLLLFNQSYNKNIPYPEFGYGTICNSYIIISNNQFGYWYSMSNLSSITLDANITMTNINPETTTNFKCFADQDVLGIYISGNRTLVAYYYRNNRIIAPNNNTNNNTTNNNTNNTNNTNKNTNNNNNTTNISSINANTNAIIANNINNAKAVTNPINTTNNGSISPHFPTNNTFAPTNSNNSNSHIFYSHTTNQTNPYISTIVHYSITQLQNIQNIQKFNSTINTATFLNANPILRSFVRPIINLLDDFWFYKFHSIVYPQFVETFTQQVDILNQLRIKPSFLNVEVQFYICQKHNYLYSTQNILQSKAPDTIFYLEATKDIYTINFAMTLVWFASLLIVRYIFEVFSKANKIFQKVYNLLKLNTMRWLLLIGLIQSNIGPLTFYGQIQFNEFISFDFFSKINLFFTTLFFFIVITYSFIFYPLIYRYEVTKNSKQTLQFSIFSSQSFWLQSVFKCLKCFFLAFVHGFFINNQFAQILSLIFVSLAEFLAVIFFRKQFKSKIIFVLFFSYMLTFFIFNVGLMLYTIQLENGTYSQQKAFAYNYIFIIVILQLFVITLLRIITMIVLQIIIKIKKFRKKNKIQIKSRVKMNAKSSLTYNIKQSQKRSFMQTNLISFQKYQQQTKKKQKQIYRLPTKVINKNIKHINTCKQIVIQNNSNNSNQVFNSKNQTNKKFKNLKIKTQKFVMKYNIQNNDYKFEPKIFFKSFRSFNNSNFFNIIQNQKSIN